MTEELVLDSLEQLLPGLAEYVAIPSVSRSASVDTMRQAADWVAAQLDFAGGRVVEAGGFPIVRGEWLSAAPAPTVLVYGHYDVQPVGRLDEWHTDPFEMVVDGDVVRGRGVTDDKGPVYLVLKLAQAFIRQRGGLPINVKFLIEGEEEIGSPNLADYVRGHAAELDCDLVISADGAQWRSGEPSLAIASKGLVTLDITVNGANSDLHSGRFGGTVANPLHALSAILAGLHDSHGRVTVAGFYDGVEALAAQRREEIAAVPFAEEEYRDSLGVPELFGEEGFTTLERLWERPTLEITGVTGGGKYSIIPHTAIGHLAARLVGDQDPERVARAIERHLQAITIPGVTISTVIDKGGVPAYRIDGDHPAIRAAAAALEHVYPGEGVLLAVIAGTLPAATLFEEVLRSKTLFFSFSTSDENLHAPNEFLRLRRIHEGMRAWENLWLQLASGPNALDRAPRAEGQSE